MFRGHLRLSGSFALPFQTKPSLYAQPAAAQVGQELLDTTGGDVANEAPFALAHDLTRLRSEFPNVLFRIAFVAQMLLEIVHVFHQWLLAVLLKRISLPCSFPFGLEHQLVQHRLGRRFVSGKRYATVYTRASL